MRPRRTRCSVMRARCPPKKMTGEFSTLRAHHGAGQVGDARSERADAKAGLSRHAGDRLRHEARRIPRGGVQRLFQPRFSAACEHVNEVRVGDAEERLDALGFEELQDAFVDFYGHGQVSPPRQLLATNCLDKFCSSLSLEEHGSTLCRT